MTQDKTLRDEFYSKIADFSIHQPIGYPVEAYTMQIIADFYEDKIKSVVREMRKELPKKEDYLPDDGSSVAYWEMNRQVTGYNQFGDDLLERLGIK